MNGSGMPTTGSTPLTHQRMKEAAYTEILRMIKEEEPPKPSTRLSDSGEALASRTSFGALLVGEPTPAGLVYRGRVGSGIAGKVGPMLKEVLTPFARDTSPFADEVPRLDALGTRWVEPVLVVDVESLGLSAQQRLRQPAFVGARPDLTPEDL